MNDQERNSASPPAPGGDGVRVTEFRGRRSYAPLLYKALAVVLVCCSAAYLAKTLRDETRDTADDIATVSTRASDANNNDSPHHAAMRDRAIEARPASSKRDPDDLANYVSPGQPAPTAAEVIDRLHKAGIHTGIGAFTPPGTSPPLIGLAVPDDYTLPEGYVRHFQATDDGQRIEAILMYSPDYDFYDSEGRRIAIPENRVVPANRAPPGLAVRLIEIPPPVDAHVPGAQAPNT